MKRKPQTAEQKKLAEKRAAWLVANPYCMVPCCQNLSRDCHEIARGSHRAIAVKEVCTWLALCRRHHDEMDDYSIWPIARQLAVKAIKDIDNYSRIDVNLIRGRQPEAITQDEVAEEIRKFQRELRA